MDNANDTDDADACSDCPLCADPNVELEHANASKLASEPMRRIMGMELLMHGLISDKELYRRMCAEFNNKVRSKMIQSGLTCQKWTPALLNKHFRKHVTLLPRRILAEQLAMCVRMSRFNWSDVENEMTEGNEDPMDIKFVQKGTSLATCIAKLIKEHQTCVKEDMASTGFETMWRSTQHNEATQMMQVKAVVEKAALMQSSLGAGDRPSAQTLFEA